MRFGVVLLLGVVACTAFGQEPSDLNEQFIWEGLSNLQKEQTYELTLTGREKIGDEYHTFASQLVWNCVNSAQVTLYDWDTTPKTPRLLRRFVGDGRTLWFYDFVNSRYRATPYSGYGAAGPNPEKDAPRLLAQLYSQSTGPATYLARLMREINPPYGDLQPRYQTWAPGYEPVQPPTAPPIRDPIIPMRLYMDLGNLAYVVYGSKEKSPTRSVAFELINTAPKGAIDYHLQAIYFAEKTPSRLTDWSIGVVDSVIIAPGAFNPYDSRNVEGWQQLPPSRAAG